jgi:hypothetical protein
MIAILEGWLCLRRLRTHFQKLPPEQVALRSQDEEFPKHLSECGLVHTVESGDRAEVRLPMPQQPDHLDVAMCFRFQPASQSHAVDAIVDVNFQEVGRMRLGGRLILSWRPSEDVALAVLGTRALHSKGRW